MSLHQTGYVPENTWGYYDLNFGTGSNCCFQPYGPGLVKLTTHAVVSGTTLMTPAQSQAYMMKAEAAKQRSVKVNPQMLASVPPNQLGI